MSQPQDGEDRKLEIAGQIAALSRLLGMIPMGDNLELGDPVTQRSMLFTEWLDELRGSFLKLSLLIGRELDIPLR